MIETQSVTVRFPGSLRAHCGGASKLAVSAANVQGVLDEIARLHPNLHRDICEETGKVRRHLNLFVNMDHVRDLDGLATQLAPGDVVTILPAVSGG